MGESKDSYLRRVHGKTEDEFDAECQFQNDLCAICRQPNKRKDGTILSLCNDHNHATDMQRGLLCHRCNKVLGMVKDSRPLLAKMFLYLEDWDGPDPANPYRVIAPLTLAPVPLDFGSPKDPMPVPFEVVAGELQEDPAELTEFLLKR